jgi:hypothetical protein
VLEAAQAQTLELLQDASTVYVLHDSCDIWKPSAAQMEYIGKVLSLSKQVINGYKTFNSVAVAVDKQGVQLLSHTIYSTALPNQVSQEVLEKLETCPPATQALVAENQHLNTAIIYQKHLQESREVLKKANPGVSICYISDRGFDGEDYFEAIDQQGDSFITRLKLSRLSNQTRVVLTPKARFPKKWLIKK